MTTLYVARDGNDAWSGSLPAPDRAGGDGPLATIQRVFDVVRILREQVAPDDAVTVCVRSGRYEIDHTVHVGPMHSGTEQAPVEFKAFPGETVVLTGGRQIPHFQPVTEPAILSRLPEEARGHVVCASLTALGVDDTGSPVEACQRMELFQDDRPMTLARWPNDGFATVAEVTGDAPFTVHGIAGDRTGRFRYDDDRPARWTEEPDLYLHGYWFWDWADAFQRVHRIDPDNRTIELETPYHHYGFRPGQRYYALNALCELDAPGEWYVDRESAILYFWPPNPVTEVNTYVSVLTTLIAIENAGWISFEGFIFEGARGNAITVTGSEHIELRRCTIRNTGSYGVSFEAGRACGIRDCTVYQTGEGGVLLDGGDRPTLTPAEHYVENSHLYDFGRLYRTYRPAVRIMGVGNRIRHNRIHNGPHNAIQLNGNDHLIEYNEIFDVCYETGDVGAFYMGRDWSERGTVIRFNYFHDIKGPGLHGAMSVYLDDAASGICIYGNLFVRASRAAFIGGGRDNTVENNVFVDCDPSVHVDARGMSWMQSTVEEGGVMPDRLRAIPFTGSPWKERYPELIDLLDGARGAPTGNRILRNVSIDGRWTYIEEAAAGFVTFEDNLVDVDPGFVDPDRDNYHLREDSPVWKVGFVALPLDRIGPVQPG